MKKGFSDVITKYGLLIFSYFLVLALKFKYFSICFSSYPSLFRFAILIF